MRRLHGIIKRSAWLIHQPAWVALLIVTPKISYRLVKTRRVSCGYIYKSRLVDWVVIEFCGCDKYGNEKITYLWYFCWMLKTYLNDKGQQVIFADIHLKCFQSKRKMSSHEMKQVCVKNYHFEYPYLGLFRKICESPVLSSLKLLCRSSILYSRFVAVWRYNKATSHT